MDEAIWLCPQPMDPTQNGRLKADYVPTAEDVRRWPVLRQHTGVWKLYIEALGKFSEEELGRLARMIREQRLQVAVELGGCRMTVGQCPEQEIGVRSAEMEWKYLERFLKQGGRVDYITTDHALAEYMTGRSHALSLPRYQQMLQQMAYFRRMRTYLPEVKCGSIESLGFFWVRGLSGRQYEAVDPTLTRLDIETYFEEYRQAAAEADVPLDHFHIDYGMEFALTDGDEASGTPDFGRILAVEALCRRYGLASGFIAANAFEDHFVINRAAEDEAEACRSAERNTLRYFRGYLQAGGNADYLIFQRWQPYPRAIGPTEESPDSQLGLFLQMLRLKTQEK